MRHSVNLISFMRARARRRPSAHGPRSRRIAGVAKAALSFPGLRLVVVVAVIGSLLASLPASLNHGAKHVAGKHSLARRRLDDALSSVSVPTTIGPVGTFEYAAIGSKNEVEVLNEATNTVVGAPITVGTNPDAIDFWPGLRGSHAEVVVANKGSDSVSVIDAVTASVVASISLPSGYSPTGVATTPIAPYTVVVDSPNTGSGGEISVVDLATNTLVGSESLAIASGTPSAIAFTPNGQSAFITDGAAHQLETLSFDTAGTDDFDVDTPYTGTSSFDPVGVASDMTTPGATSFYVADAGGTGALDTFSDEGTETRATPISAIPADVAVAPGGADVYLQVPGAKHVVDVPVGSGASPVTITTSVASAGPLAVSSDTSTLVVGDATTSSTDDELMSTASDEPQQTATLAGPVSAVVTARPAPEAPVSSSSTVAYVAIGSKNEVEAVDEQTGAVIGAPIEVGGDPDGVAVWSPEGETHPEVLVANWSSDSASLIDALTHRVVATITLPVGAKPTAAAVNGVPNTGTRFGMVVDSGLGEVSVINLMSGTLVGNISLALSSGSAGQIAYAPNGLSAYVTDKTGHEIAVLNWNGNAANDYYVLGTPFTNGANFDPIAVAGDTSNPNSKRIYATDAGSGTGCSSNCLDTLQYSSGLSLVSSTALPTTPGDLTVAPGAGLIYVQLSSTNDVAQVSTASNTVTSIATTPSAGRVAVAADGSVLAVGDNTSGATDTELMSTATGAALNTVTLDGSASAIATAHLTNLDDYAYVANTQSNTLSIIDATSGSVIQTVAVGADPNSVAVSPDGSYVYVANENAGTVSVIAASNIAAPGVSSPVVATITLTTPAGGVTPSPGSIAVSPNGDSVLVSDGSNGTVHVIDTNPADVSAVDTDVNQFALTCSGTTSSSVAGQLAFSPDGAFAYMTTSDPGVTVLEASSATTTGYTCDQEQTASSTNALPIFGSTHYPAANLTGAAVSPNDQTLWIADYQDRELFPFTITAAGYLSPALPTAINVGADPESVSLSPEGQTAYVEDFPPGAGTNGSTVVVDTATDTVLATVVNNRGSSVALSPDGRQYTETDYYVNTGHGVSYDDTVGIYATTAEGATPADGLLYEVSVGTSGPGPNDVVYAPRPLAPSGGSPSPAELAGGDNNPSGSGVSGIDDVVSAETPKGLPGASAGVNTALGSYSFSLDAMSVPDIGIPLDLSLTYDSAHASTNGAFGYGWNYSYGMTATQNAYNAAQNPCAVTITEEDGSTVSFQPSTTSGFTSGCPGLTYEPEPWVQANLSVVSSCNGTDSCWDLTRSDGTQYEIDQTNGELVKEIDLNVNAVTLKYGAVSGVSPCSANTSSELCEVIGASGVRSLKFTWTSGEVTSVTDGTRTVTLTYSSSDLATISLTPASGSGAVTPKYAFSYSSNLLTSWWDPDKEATNAGQTGYATDVTYGTGSGACPANATTTVCYVTAPRIVDSGTSMTATYTPKSAFAYPGSYPTYSALDPATGTGTVEVTDPNYNANLAGGDVTLDTYVDRVLVSQTQGYGSYARTIAGGLTASSATLTDPGNSFTQADVGRPVYDTSNGSYIPAGTIISSVQSAGQATMSAAATHAAAADTIVVGHANYRRTIAGSLTVNSSTLTDPAGSFSQLDVGRAVSDETHASYVPADTVISSVQSATQATMSSTASATATGDTVLLKPGLSPVSTTMHDPLTLTANDSLDPLGNITTTSVDAEANTLSSTDPMGRTTSSLYNPFNEVTSSTDALGNTTLSSYDSHGNELTTTDPMGNVTSYAYNSNGTQCATMNANGHGAGAPLPVCFTPAPTKLSSALTNGNNYTSLSLSSAMTAPSGTTVLIFQTASGVYHEVSTTLSAAASGSTTLTVNSFRANYSYATTPAPGAFVAFVSPYVTEYGYDAQGDQTSTTAYDGPSTAATAGYTTTSLYNSIGQECESLTADGFAAGDTLPSSCPSSAAASESVNTAFDYYGNVLSSISPTNAVGGTTTNTYDGNGNVLTTASANGTITNSAYGADNQLCWSEPTTASSNFCTSPPTGAGTETTTDFYDADLNQVATVSPDGNAGSNPDCLYETITAFDDPGNTLSTTTPTGGSTCSNVTTTVSWSTYDAAGNAVTSGTQAPQGQSSDVITTNAYDADGEQCWSDVAVVANPTCAAPPTGSPSETTTNTYDADGNEVATISADGNASGSPYNYATTSAYNAAGKLVTQTLPPPASSSTALNIGETTTNYYDADGNGVAVTQAQGSPGSCNPLTSSGCPYTTYNVFDEQGLTLSTTYPNGNTTSYTYDTDGNQLVVTDSSANTTTYGYDGADNVASTTTASGGTEDFYDADGNEIAVTGPGGNPLTCNPGGPGDGYSTPSYYQTGCPYTTYYTYNSSNQVVQTTKIGTQAGTATTTNFYDANGETVAVTGAAGNPSTCNAGPQGDGFTNTPYNQTGCADTAYYSYNNAGQVTQVSYTDGTPAVSYTYGPDGQVASMTDGTGTTYYTYDSSGRLCRTATSTSGTASCSTTTGTILSYAYDASSNLTCLTYPGAATTCANAPSPGTTDVATYGYNDTNQLSSMTDWTGPGYHTFSFAYNQDGQECMESTAASPSCGAPPTQSGAVATAYSYDQAGNTSDIQTTLGNATGGTSNLLDLNVGSANVANSTTTANSTTVTTTASFTTSGITAGMSVSGSGIAAGTSVQTVSSATQLTLSAAATASGTGTLTFSYRNPDGFIVKEVPTVGPTLYPADVYAYNASDQVAAGPITGSSGSNSYAYTSAGGITADTTSFASAAYDNAGALCWTYSAASSNACSSPPSGATIYTANQDGERTATTPPSGNKEAFGWDTQSGLLTCANTNGGTCSTLSPTSTTTVYTYTGDGLRASSKINSVTTNYTWDTSTGTPRLLFDGSWDYLYIPGNATPIEQVDASGSSPTCDILLSDENGNVRGLVQISTGAHADQLVNYADYDAYGDPITESGGSVEGGGMTVAQTGINSNWVGTTPWGYGEGYTDSTGLVYLVHRYYDPSTGEFLSVDPSVDQTQQPYDYASDDPINALDPFGLHSCDWNPLSWGGCIWNALDEGVHLVATAWDKVNNLVNNLYGDAAHAFARAVKWSGKFLARAGKHLWHGVDHALHAVLDHTFILDILAVAACLAPFVDFFGCAIFTAVALAGRVAARSIHHDRNALTADLVDIGVTAASLGLVGFTSDIGRGAEAFERLDISESDANQAKDIIGKCRSRIVRLHAALPDLFSAFFSRYETSLRQAQRSRKNH